MRRDDNLNVAAARRGRRGLGTGRRGVRRGLRVGLGAAVELGPDAGEGLLRGAEDDAFRIRMRVRVRVRVRVRARARARARARVEVRMRVRVRVRVRVRIRVRVRVVKTACSSPWLTM